MLSTEAMSHLLRLAHAVGLVTLDVGARGGVSKDFLPFSNAVEQYGFEPDPEECDRLNRPEGRGPWKSITFIPAALAATDGHFDLNLYRRRGCSSKLQARPDLGRLFSREDYYVHEETVTVPARRLDTVVARHPIEQPAFLKIDVQGMEVECFSGAHDTLSNDLVGIRTEVSFFPIYKDQPLFAEIDQALRPYNFVPMRWLEFHEWRRITRTKFPRVDSGDMPFSRGQMMHGDILYLLHPESISSESDAELKRLVRLGLIATCYEHFDHACATFARPRVREFCQTFAAVDPIQATEALSQAKASRYKGMRGFLRKAMRHLS